MTANDFVNVDDAVHAGWVTCGSGRFLITKASRSGFNLEIEAPNVGDIRRRLHYRWRLRFAQVREEGLHSMVIGPLQSKWLGEYLEDLGEALENPERLRWEACDLVEDPDTYTQPRKFPRSPGATVGGGC